MNPIYITPGYLRRLGACSTAAYERVFGVEPVLLDATSLERARKAGLKLAWLVWRLPLEAIGWAVTDPNAYVRYDAAQRLPLDTIGWAVTDADASVRRAAAERLPLDAIVWAVTDQDAEVRQAAAQRLPLEAIGWAVTDADASVRQAAAWRLPVDAIDWAATDTDAGVRQAAAWRLPVDTIGWAVTDPAACVRLAAAQRLPVEAIVWAVTDPDAGVRRAAAERGVAIPNVPAPAVVGGSAPTVPPTVAGPSSEPDPLSPCAVVSSGDGGPRAEYDREIEATRAERIGRRRAEQRCRELATERDLAVWAGRVVALGAGLLALAEAMVCHSASWDCVVMGWCFVPVGAACMVQGLAWPERSGWLQRAVEALVRGAA